MAGTLHDRAQREANRLHANAKDGTAVIDGKRYDLKFDGNAGLYVVTLDGEFVVQFNTRKVTQARTWLREYLA